jgi:dsRNA-specific ribonuclease
MQDPLFVDHLSTTQVTVPVDPSTGKINSAHDVNEDDTNRNQFHHYEKSVTEALHLLQEYTTELLGDPLQTLQGYYQKRRVTSLASAWQVPHYYRIGRGKESKTYWRFIFQCPLEDSVLATSVVARPLLRMEMGGALPSEDRQRLAELSQQWFGDFVLSPYDGYVYFGTKMNAKRSAAFGALYKIFGMQGKSPKKHFQSKKRKQINKPDLPYPDQTIKSLEKKIRKLAKIPWIHDLHRCGVKHVDILYKEHISMVEDIPSTLSPTNIICQMEIQEPVEMKVESDPHPSKALARGQAVKRLIVAMKTRLGVSETTTTNERRDESEDSAFPLSCIMEKENLLHCDSPYLHMQMQLPKWARWIPQNGDRAILYRLNISGPVPLFELPANQRTSIGLILPYDPTLCIEKEVLSFQARFNFQDNQGHWRADLVNPKTIRVDQAELLDDYATICSAWKQYGMNRPLKTQRDRINTNHRNYHFVPLKLQENLMIIDWDLMARVVTNKTQPYLVATRRVDFLYHFLPACLAFHLLRSFWNLDVEGALIVTCVLIIMSFGFLFPKFSYRMNGSEFPNRFLSYNARKNFVFIPSHHPVIRLPALSHVCNEKAQPTPSIEPTARQDHLALVKPRFTDLFRTRFNTILKHPSIHLLSAHPANKLSDFNPLTSKKGEQLSLELAPRQTLIPELVHILPMPRDFLFVVGSAEKFMIPLEASISHSIKARNLMEATTSIGQSVLGFPDGSARTTSEQTPICLSTFTKSLAEATTIFPTSRYERLEFLGDRTLNYMVSLCLFTRNGDLEWDGDDLKEHCTAAKRNLALADGALRTGLNRFLHAGPIRWKEADAFFSIPDNHITNMGESILGAMIVQDAICGDCHAQTEWMLAGFMECLNLPVPHRDGVGEIFSKPWFRGTRLCRRDGFNFGGHNLWALRLREVEEAFAKTVCVRKVLDLKGERLISKLLPHNSHDLLRLRLMSGIPRLLLDIAVFDASLDGSDSLIRDPSDQAELQVAGMIRDNLFHVGSTALELELCRDLFLLNPSATPSDLHLLQVCAQTHDVLSYILLKNELHTCLFDEDLASESKILQTIETADAIGETLWKENGGWILPGGLSTFHSRLENCRQKGLASRCSGSTSDGWMLPRYPALAGGRLHGYDEKLKMNEIVDWQFSLKCIFGALVLSLGAEPSWTLLFRPMLEEVMLLTADEYRNIFAESSAICKCYTRGNTNCLLPDE